MTCDGNAESGAATETRNRTRKAADAAHKIAFYTAYWAAHKAAIAAEAGKREAAKTAELERQIAYLKNSLGGSSQ